MSDRGFRRAFAAGLGKIEKRVNRIEYKCLFPGCTATSIQSHSQQKERQLRSIARDGLVYALNRNHYQAVKAGSYEGPHMMRLHGIAEASAFPGYCGQHDRELFHRLDNEPLTLNDKEQSWLLFLRTFSYEFSQKRRSFEWNRQFQDLMRGLGNHEAAEELEIMRAGVKKFLEVDAAHYFSYLWDGFDSKRFEGVSTAWVKVDENIGLSSSCVFSPLLDAHDKYMTYSFDKPQPLLCFNLIPSAAESHVVVSWLDEYSPLAAWVHDAVAAQENLEQFIHQAAFAESEDTCINPDLWESLSPETQGALVNAMRHEMWRGPIDGVPQIISLRKNDI